MPTLPLLQVDAFTRTPLAGNPCAIVFDADRLDADTMQAVAREMNLSETSFVLRSERADFRARYFTPSQEIPMAGHPTVATVFGLVETGRLKLTGHSTRVSLELNVGPIDVDVEARDGAVVQVVMAQKAPSFGPELDGSTVAAAFGLAAEDLLAPAQVVSTGTPQLMVPLREAAALRRVQVDLGRYAALKRGSASSARTSSVSGARLPPATRSRVTSCPTSSRTRSPARAPAAWAPISGVAG